MASTLTTGLSFSCVKLERSLCHASCALRANPLLIVFCLQAMLKMTLSVCNHPAAHRMLSRRIKGLELQVWEFAMDRQWGFDHEIPVRRTCPIKHFYNIGFEVWGSCCRAWAFSLSCLPSVPCARDWRTWRLSLNPNRNSESDILQSVLDQRKDVGQPGAARVATRVTLR